MFERVVFSSVWMFNPDIVGLVRELGGLGYVTARVRPVFDGYDIGFLEARNVIAIKGMVRVSYDFGRRMLGVEGVKVGEVVLCAGEVEKVLDKLGVNVEDGVLFYEVQVRGRVSGVDLPKKEVKLGDRVLMGLVTDYVSGNPGTTRFLHVRVYPLWATWKEKPRVYELTVVYRDDKRVLMEFLENVENVLNGFLQSLSSL